MIACVEDKYLEHNNRKRKVERARKGEVCWEEILGDLLDLHDDIEEQGNDRFNEIVFMILCSEGVDDPVMRSAMDFAQTFYTKEGPSPIHEELWWKQMLPMS